MIAPYRQQDSLPRIVLERGVDGVIFLSPPSEEVVQQMAMPVVSLGTSGTAYAVIRAEEILLSVEPHPSSARNVFRGRIVEVASSGALTRVTVDVQDTPIIAALTTRSAEELQLSSAWPRRETSRRRWSSRPSNPTRTC